MNAIYDRLLPVLANSFQFLHQKAKGKLIIAQTQIKNRSLGSGKGSLNDALLNITRAIELAKQYPDAKNIDETLFHMLYTKGRVLIEYSCISINRVPQAVDACYELYEAQNSFRHNVYDFAKGTGNDKKSFEKFKRVLIYDKRIKSFYDLDKRKAEYLLSRWTGKCVSYTK